MVFRPPKVHVLLATMRTRPSQLPAIFLMSALMLLMAVFAVVQASCLGQPVFPDEFDYIGLAERLVEQGALVQEDGSPTAFRPPGYPAFVAAVFAVSPSVLAVQVVQYLMHFGAAALVFAAMRRAPGLPEPAAYVSTTVVLLYPLFLYAALRLYPQTMTAFAFVLFLYLCFAVEEKSWAVTVAAAAVGLALTMATPIFLPLVALNAVFAFPVRRLALIACVLGLGIAGWIVRNDIVLGEATFATNSGINLLVGNSPYAAPSLGRHTDLSAYSEGARGLDEVARNTYYREQAVDWIASNPQAAFTRYLRKLVNFFNFENQLRTESEQTRLRSVVLFLSYYGAAVPSLLFAAAALRRHRWARVALLNYFGTALLYSIFFNRIRFRIPADYLLFMMAGPSLLILFGAARSLVARSRMH